MELLLVFHGGEEIGQGLPFINGANQRFADLIVGQLQRSFAEHALGRMVFGLVGITMIEHGRAQL